MSLSPIQIAEIFTDYVASMTYRDMLIADMAENMKLVQKELKRVKMESARLSGKFDQLIDDGI